MQFPNPISRVVIPCVLLLVCSLSGFAQDGKLKINASPKQAYVFIDNHPAAEANHHTFQLSAGDHRIDLYNYGYNTATQNVTITEGQTTSLNLKLEAIPGEVPGPRGCITLEGANRYAVLLNGKTPAYFVGHGDEFNHEWWWKQELIVPPGKHQLTVMDKEKEVWSGSVEVPADQRVVVGIPDGVRKTVAWPRGERLSALARFKAGTASASVVISKPTAQLSASTAQVNCGDPAQLKWSSSDAAEVNIEPVGTVAASGEQEVKPKQTTNYLLTASGPGGIATSGTTVAVNPLQATLTVSPAEVRYRQVGDKVVEQGNATLNWTSSSAKDVSIQPLGTVSTAGDQVVQVKPQKGDVGQVDETITYTLNATNECGGNETKTATVHIVGSIEPNPEVALRSVYFPTDYPKVRQPNGGLLRSQQQTLSILADEFKKYTEFNPDVHLILDGHADRRGPRMYNQALSQRRADRTKEFLVAQGIPADRIDVRAHGYQKNLTTAEVKELTGQNPDAAEAEQQQKVKSLRTLVLANNRRVDISLSTGQESLRYYPFKAEDVAVLLDRQPTTPKVETAVGQ